MSVPFRPSLDQLEARDTPTASGLFAVGAGPGGVPRLQVYDVTTGVKVADFLAYEPTFTGGVTAAVGDVTNDGFPDIIVGAGNGGGPRVRVFDGRAFRTPTTVGILPAPTDGTSFIADSSVVADFFAFEASQRGGSFVAAGEFGGGGFNEIVIGAGPGGGPRVRILDGLQIATQRRAFTANGNFDTVANFFAFESTFRNGVVVSANPLLLANGFSDLVVTPGLGGGPRVRVLNGLDIANEKLQYTSVGPNDGIADFFAADPNSRSGLFVTTADYSFDGIPDVAVGTGKGLPGQITVYSGSVIRQRGGTFTGQAAGDILSQFPVLPTGATSYSNGVTVGSALPLSGTNSLLLYGVGGTGFPAEAVALRFTTGAGFITRTVVYDLFFDSKFNGGVFVSN